MYSIYYFIDLSIIEIVFYFIFNYFLSLPFQESIRVKNDYIIIICDGEINMGNVFVNRTRIR